MKTTMASIAQSLIDELINKSESEENDESDIHYDPRALEDEEGEEGEEMIESNDVEEHDAPESKSTRPTGSKRGTKKRKWVETDLKEILLDEFTEVTGPLMNFHRKTSP